MKKLLGILVLAACVVSLASGLALAEKFVVGYQPYDTISYQAIVNMELGLWKKHVPYGTEFEFLPALQGTVVAGYMLAGKAVAGYMSVMPATFLCSKPEQAEMVMVATLGMSEGTRCSLVLVRKDAPKFKNDEELARWLDGKVIAAPKGSASDQFLRKFFEKFKVKPSEYLHQSIHAIAANFRSGKLDAASLWEPTLSYLATDVGDGVARIAANGRACDNPDLGILVMRKDFIEKFPEVAKGYLKAELEAQTYLLDPKNWNNVIEMVAKHATGVPKKVLWYSIYGRVPADSKEEIREWKSFYFNEREKKNIIEVAPFLIKENVIPEGSLKPGYFDDSLARAVFQESGRTPVSDSVTLGVIKGALASECPFKD